MNAILHIQEKIKANSKTSSMFRYLTYYLVRKFWAITSFVGYAMSFETVISVISTYESMAQQTIS